MMRSRKGWMEAALVLALFSASFTICYLAMRAFRNAGIQPFFYQTNFEPAVMMACGRGFVTASTATIPPALLEFLRVTRNTFDCSLLPASLPRLPLTSPGNATWYYLYGTTAILWRLMGISWTALDVLVSVFGGVVTVLLYGLFRLVSSWSVAAAAALLLTISPANLTHLISVRDYSKAPFVLAGILVLGILVLRPMRFSRTLALAGLYGAVVGLGYGFRSDLAVMVLFGALVVLLFLPGSWRLHAARNGLATAVLIAAFLAVAWPVLSGLKWGGCQFHIALLGLTTPLTTELGVTPSLYSFGDHFLDTFVDLKVGDYAHRVLNQPVPNLCSSGYDTASGHLFAQMATTFPADLVTHAYGSVLAILREGLAIPALTHPVSPSFVGRLVALGYRVLHRVTEMVAPVGAPLVLAAVVVAWAHSVRLGLALTTFVLFLAGYPAIEFEERHWFHLRFIPWWAAVLVGEQILRNGVRSWRRPALIRAAAGAALVLVTLAVALAALRVLQTRRVGSLIARYEAAATTEIPTERGNGSVVAVRWQSPDYGPPPSHRRSDLMVVMLDGRQCGDGEPVLLRIRYEADGPSHDMSTAFAVARPGADEAPTRVFVPVFWTGFDEHTYLRFSGVEVVGASPACIGPVARVVDAASVPLWITMQVPANWRAQRLYQSIDSRWWRRHR
jgi:hypothetical protein